MEQVSNSLPMRKSSAGDHIETRPIYIEDWLDSLAYIDFQKTSRLLYEATKQTNQQALKPSVRIELVEIYNRPYQYYLDSQISTGAQHTLQTIETMQEQIDVLKLIAANLSFACKLAVEETFNNKTMWGQSKPPLPAMLMSLNYLSHALIFSFLEYAPTPKNVWRELNFNYSFAEDLKQENTIIIPPGGDPKKDATSIANAYKRITLAALADPHHLPFGAVWETFKQLGSWTEYTQIKPFETLSDPKSIFVIDLESDSSPVAYSKFDEKTGNNNHRLLDASTLKTLIQKHLDLLEMGQGLDDSIQLSPYFAKSILKQLSKSWGLPPKRFSPRQARKGSLNLACGLNSIYFYVNGEQEFVTPSTAENNDTTIDTGDLIEETDAAAPATYSYEHWGLVNQCPGGFAVITSEKPKNLAQVGDLVGIQKNSADTDSSAKWALGVIRWLMVRQNKIHKIGIQTIASDIFPAAIRATSGSLIESQFRRAFIVGDFTTSDKNTIITSKGLFMNDRKLEISYQDKFFQVTTHSLVEGAFSFEHLSVKHATAINIEA